MSELEPTGRVLVVDDEETLRVTLSAVLEVEGFEAVEAASAEEALECLSRESFDLVLSDVRMPGVGGVELARQLRMTQPGLPVVLMTAFAEESALRDALGQGVFTVLSKPFDPTRATGILRRALRRPAVLVVDDVQEVAEAVSASLLQKGLRVHFATDAQLAVAEARARAIDVFLLDLAMPRVGGLEVARLLREQHPDAQIIVFSGADDADALIKQAGRGEQIFRFLRKPLSTETLVRVIAEARKVA